MAILTKSAGRVSRYLTFVVMSLGLLLASSALTSCEDDDPYGYGDDWYLTGTWANVQDYSETYTFYYDGTGYWQTYDGDYLEFDYYCEGGSIYFTFYPDYGPSYGMNCGVAYNGGSSLIITYPPGNGWGYTSVSYIRVS